MRIKILLSFLMIVLCFQGCRQESQKGVSEEEYRRTTEALVGANRILVEKDRARIEAFAGRMGWDMKESQTGLWYQVYEYGSGDKASKGMVITLEYILSLTDGTVCYSSDSLGYKKFLVGSGGVETGLEEGVLMLKEGDRARFIMPPHLAHGFTGDGNKIPQRAIIVYDVKVIKLDPPETAN